MNRNPKLTLFFAACLFFSHFSFGVLTKWGATHRMSKKEYAALKEINNHCPDTWCEGAWNLLFHNLRCNSVISKPTNCKLHFTIYPDAPPVRLIPAGSNQGTKLHLSQGMQANCTMVGLPELWKPFR